jgi:serine/threonine protein kinase
MEVLQGDCYDNFLTEKADTLSLWTKVYLLLNIVSGLRHLNGYNIVHLDLKPLNIIVCKSLIPKILDYGEAYHKDLAKKSTNYAT